MSLTLLFNQYFEAPAVVAPPPQLSGGYGFGGGSAGRGHWPPSTDLTPRRKVKPRHRQIRAIEQKLRKAVELVPHELEILARLARRAHNAPSGSQEAAGATIAPLPVLVEALTVNPSDRGLSQELADELARILNRGPEPAPEQLEDAGGVEISPPELVSIGEGIYPPIAPELDRRIRLILLPRETVRLVPIPRVTPLDVEEEEMLVLALAVA
jgi:hypothetical protein